MGLISHSASCSEHSRVLDITGGLGHPAESYVHCRLQGPAKGGDGEIRCVFGILSIRESPERHL